MSGSGTKENTKIVEAVKNRRLFEEYLDETEKEIHELIDGCTSQHPYGAYSNQTDDSIKNAGVCYASTVNKAENFYKPMDLFHIPIRGQHLTIAMEVFFELVNAFGEKKMLVKKQGRMIFLPVRVRLQIIQTSIMQR